MTWKVRPKTHMRPIPRREMIDSSTGEPDFAVAQPHGSGHNVEQCGLAGAVGTDEPCYRALVDRQIDTVDSPDATERANSTAYVEQWRSDRVAICDGRPAG